MKFILKLILIIAVVLSSHASPVVRADVTGDNNRDAYIGTGGLLLPTSFTGGASKAQTVSACLGCTWKYSVYCSQGNADLCTHAVATCPVGQMRYRVWFGKTKTSIAVIGSVCWGTGTPATRRSLEKRIRDTAIRYVPVLQLGVQPVDGTVTAIPIIGRTGQPTSYTPPAMLIAGRRVLITAKAQWRWHWGDGTSQWKSVPGAAYPSQQITHRYRVVGTYRIAVQTVWSATYFVSGLGTYPVTGEVVTQESSLMVPVRSAQTALTPWE